MRVREREQSARLTYFKVCYLSNGYLIVEVLDYSVLPCYNTLLTNTCWTTICWN